MGRKHKHSSLKYIRQNLIRKNKNLTRVNDSLQIMSNHATIRNIESRKKVVELENCNHALIEIMSMQKEANDFLQQKIDILETQLSLLNNSEMGTLLNNQEVNSFSSTLMLASSVKINNIRSEEGEEDEDDLEKVDELLAFTQQAKYFFEKISNIIQRQQEQQNNEPYGVPGSSRAVSSRSSSQAVSSRGSSQAGSQQEPILISSDEDITIKMEKSDTAVTSGISEKDEDKSAVTSATNEKDRGTKKAIRKKNTNDSDKNSRKAISDKAKGKVPVQSSSDDSSSSDSSYSSNSSNTPFYLTKSDMPKDLSDALRKEVIWKYDALPEGKRIDLGQTFTNQQNRVINDIIPSIMKNINNNIFPISNKILYDIIHSLHRHRCKEHLKKNRSSSGKKLQEKRKHSNSRQKIKKGKINKTFTDGEEFTSQEI
ncbi:hypothetical protein RclHR1_05620015 [Rhizophagus clarus]|uniref:Uncharacterized protein n=1 Tax=Rhizophagus clarus TaxID=94130 RepID=A0A2Z6RQ07_9GLOM|nr:hypothetical protein RclHR1_05620015 [Rhizophagus clarus]